MAATLTFGELRRGAVAWAKKDLNRTLRVGAIAFAVSWLVNFIVITTWGADLANIVGGATEGTEAKGALYMAIMSLVISTLVVYGIEGGWSDLKQSFRALPRAVSRQFRQHGVRMWSIVFWGGAITLLTSGILDPTISAALGLGFLAFAPTAITGLLGKVITSFWTSLIGLFAPKNRPRPPGLGGQMIGVIGSATGFLVASQATETAFQLIAAAVLAVLSYLVLMNATSKTATTAGLILLGVAFWIGSEGIAAALGGEGCCGEDHHHPLDPGAKAATLSGIAGGAAAVGAVIGAGIGSVLASHPQNPGTWDDDDDGSGPPRVTTDPLPGGPTRTTSITLEGDAARAVLDAYRKANEAGGQADIPIPGDQQWEVYVADNEGNKATSGHMGTRGRVTGVPGVVTGEDGSIAITVDVTTYNPTPPVGPATPPTAVAAPPPTTPPPAAAGVGAGAAVGGGAGGGAGSDAAGDGGPDAPLPPPPPVVDAGQVMEQTTVPPAIEPPAAQPSPTRPSEPPPPPPETTPKPKAPRVPDGSDPGTYADWVRNTAQGTLPPPDLAAVDDLIRGGSDDVTLSGNFGGRFGPLLSNTENRTDGVAIVFPTGDRILIRTRNGRIDIRHEESMASLLVEAIADEAAGVGLKIPKPGDAIAAAREPIESFNRSIEASGRRVESIDRNPDGTIRIRLGR